MRRLLAVFITIIMISTLIVVPAFGAEAGGNVGGTPSFNNVTASFDPSTKMVSVNGRINNGANKPVTIKITDPNGSIELIKVVASSDDGSFGYSYKTLSKTEGIYNVTVAALEVTQNATASFLYEALKISIDKTSASLYTGETLQLTTTITPDYASNKRVVWQSSNANIASVSSSGFVTGLAEGTAVITAFSEADPSVKVECKVTVSKKSTGGSGGGFGGGGGGAPSTSSGDSDKPPVVELANRPVLDNKTGEAKVTVDAKAISEALSQAKADANGVKTIAVEVPKVEGATSYTTALPSSVLTVAEAAVKIELRTDLGTVVVPGNILANANIFGAKVVGISIGIADAAKLSDTVKALVGNRTVINLYVTADGRMVDYNNPDAPVKVMVPCKPSAEELQNPEHIVVWYIDGTGNAVSVPTGKYDAATGTVVFTTTHFSQYAIAFVFKTFEDITSYAWAKDAIEVMAAKGVINGTGEKTFDPASNVTRADFTLLLVKSLGLTAKVDSNFSDVNPEDYYYEAVGIARKLGLAKGEGENLFNPGSEISRQDMMVIAARAMRIANKLKADRTVAELGAFTDKADIAAYALEDIGAMVKEGIVKGDGGRINPLGNTTRAETAVLIYRVYNK